MQNTGCLLYCCRHRLQSLFTDWLHTVCTPTDELFALHQVGNYGVSYQQLKMLVVLMHIFCLYIILYIYILHICLVLFTYFIIKFKSTKSDCSNRKVEISCPSLKNKQTTVNNWVQKKNTRKTGNKHLHIKLILDKITVIKLKAINKISQVEMKSGTNKRTSHCSFLCF